MLFQKLPRVHVVLLVDLPQARRLRVNQFAPRQPVKPLQPVRNAVLIESEHRAGASLAVGDLAESERLLLLRNPVPEIQQSIKKNVIGKRGLRAALKLIKVAALTRLDEAEFRQGAVEGVFAQSRPAHVGGAD